MDKNTLKSYFLTGKKPTQGQFHELIDSFFHKDEKIDISDILNLSVLIANKVEREDIPYLIDGKQDKISNMLRTKDKSVVGAINELEAEKVNIYQERAIIIAPKFQGYAKILSVKSGSFVFDFEVNEYPGYYHNSSWDKSYTSKKFNDRIMISSGRKEGNACTLRTKDFIYNLHTDPDSGYTDIYIKADSNVLKMISLRLSFATNKAEDAIVYYESPVYTSWEYVPGVPAIVDTIQSVVENVDFKNALRIYVDEEDITTGCKELDNLVDHIDIVISSDSELPEGFYFNAADVDGQYYHENAIYRFLFNTEVENFTVKAGEETLFVYPERISQTEILTAVPPAGQGEEWIFSISNLPPTDSGNTTDNKVNDIYSPDGSIIVERDENTVNLSINPEFVSCNGAGGVSGTRYVKGYMTARTLAYNAQLLGAVFTPDQATLEGDASLIDGDHFKAPVKGLYSLFVSYTKMPTNTMRNISQILLNTVDLQHIIAQAEVGQNGNTNTVASISALVHLESGDSLFYGIYSALAQAAFGGDLFFTFSLIEPGAGQTAGGRAEKALEITDDNAEQYFEKDERGYTWLSIPQGYNIIDVQTTQNYTGTPGIRPASGDFPDYMRLTVMGNISFLQGNDYFGDYCTSRLLYTYRANGGYYGGGRMVEAYIEFMLKDKVWFTTMY